MQNAINFTSTELSNNDFHSSLFAKQTQHDVVASCTLPVDSLAWGNFVEGNISCRAITSQCNQRGGIVLSKPITDRRRSFNEQSGASKPAHLTAATCMQHACNMPATYMQFAISTLLNQHHASCCARHDMCTLNTCTHYVHTLFRTTRAVSHNARCVVASVIGHCHVGVARCALVHAMYTNRSPLPCR